MPPIKAPIPPIAVHIRSQSGPDDGVLTAATLVELAGTAAAGETWADGFIAALAELAGTVTVDETWDDGFVWALESNTPGPNFRYIARTQRIIVIRPVVPPMYITLIIESMMPVAFNIIMSKKITTRLTTTHGAHALGPADVALLAISA
jgi:hypothetical protein